MYFEEKKMHINYEKKILPNVNINLKIKDEITHINGLTTATIVSEIFKHIPSQGYIETTKTHFFNTWNAAMIPYAIGFPEKYEIQVRRTEQVIRLNQAVTIEEPFFDRSLDIPDDYLALEFLENNKIAFLTVASFNYYRWNDYNVFEKFIDSSFLEINKHETKNLIIDLRSNPGGSQSSSMHLLRYLVKKPFTYFSNAEFEGKKEKIEGETSVFPYKNRHKGSCYFIIDGVGNSTTGHFMSIVKYMDLGTIIGEELGSNQFCSAGMTTCRLSNTKLEYYVANNTHESLALTLPDEQGILPDYYVKQNIDEYLNNIDVVKNYAIELAKNAAK